jgi:hypothetical protein
MWIVWCSATCGDHRRHLLGPVLSRLRRRPGAGHAGDGVPQPFTDHRRDPYPERQRLDLRRRTGDDRVDDGDPHRRHQGDVQVAEHLLVHRQRRNPAGLRGAAVVVQERLPIALQRPLPHLRRKGQRLPGRDQHGEGPGRPSPCLRLGHGARHLRDHDLHDLELVERLPLRRAQERIQPQPPDVDHVRRAQLERDRPHRWRPAALQGDELPVHRRRQHRSQRRLRPADRTLLPPVRGPCGQQQRAHHHHRLPR